MLSVGRGWGARVQESATFYRTHRNRPAVNRTKKLVRGTAARSSRDAVKEMKIRESSQLVGAEVDPLPLGRDERYMTSMSC